MSMLTKTMNRLKIRAAHRFVLSCAAALALWFAAGASALAASKEGHALSQAWLANGQTLMQAGKHDAARTALERAIVADPGNALALAWLGANSQKLGDAEASAKYFRIALEVDPDNQGVLLLTGKAEVAGGEMAKAKEKLARLQRLCGMNCREARELEQAILATASK